MDNTIRKLKEEIKIAQHEYNILEDYERENGDIPDITSVTDLFEYWYLRWLEIALSIVQPVIPKKEYQWEFITGA